MSLRETDRSVSLPTQQRVLDVSHDLRLPLETVTETVGILARKRVGKSNAAVVIAEEMYDAGLPWVAIDPKGDWWGVRASGDGRGPGLSVVVFGGEHGDVPLEPNAGQLIADLIVEQRLTCVLDVSELFVENKAAARRFLVAFARRLYAKNREPVMVFCEEADEYVPQIVRGDDAEMVSAFETLVKRGGFRGIGVTLISQRSASLNKDVLSQISTLIALQTTSPNDKKAILGWIQEHELGADVIKQIADLDKGDAWVFSPGWLGILKRVHFRRRRTFDSGETPKVGVKARPPARLADVDLDKIRTAMAATIERARQEDPAELRKQIAELKRQLAKPATRQAVGQTKEIEKRVELPVLTKGQLQRLETVLHRGEALAKAIQEGLVALAATVRPALAPRSVSAVLRDRPAMVPPAGRRRVPPSVSTPRQETSQPSEPGSVKLGAAERKVLAVLAQWPDGRFQKDLAFLTGYSARASTLSVALSRLRQAGLIEQGQPVRPTDVGLALAGGIKELPTGPELLDYWLKHPKVGEAERKVLLTLIDVWPDALSHEELADRTGYSSVASTLSVSISKLRKLGLVEAGERRANRSFVEAIR